MTSEAARPGEVSKRRMKWASFVVQAAAMAAVVTACSFAPGAAQESGLGNDNTSGPTLVVIGDSYSEGVDNTVVWPQLLAEKRGYRLVNMSIGGTGYLNGAFATTFGDRIKSSDVERPSIIIFAGSRNDILFAPAEVRAAAREAFAAAQDRFPDARIVAVGPIWDSTAPADEVRAINSAVSQAAEASGVEFVDALEADWLADRSIIHADGIHATDAGQQVLSDGVEEAIPDLP